jgi:hypothetical protein
VKAKKDQEVDDNEIPDLQVEVAGHMVNEEEVVVVLVTEAGVQSVKGGQEEEGKAEDVVDSYQKIMQNRELLITKSNCRYLVTNVL